MFNIDNFFHADISEEFEFEQNDSFEFERYDVADYGALSSDSLQTKYIQAAIDDCYKHKGGFVTVPAGLYYVAGLRLYSDVHLHLESGAVLRGSRNLSDYNYFKKSKIEPIDFEQFANSNDIDNPFSERNKAIIYIFNAENVQISGDKGSFIEGMNCFNKKGEDGYKGPHAINIYNSKLVTLNGYTVSESGNSAHYVKDSNGFTIRNLKTYGGHHAFEMRSCDGMVFDSCVFYNSSDCVRGYDNNDLFMRNISFNCPTAALCLGGKDIVIQKCRFDSNSRFGERDQLTLKQKESSMPTDDKCGHKAQTFFRYYSDGLIKPRNTSENIRIEYCNVNCPSLFEMQYDSKNDICRKYPLKDIHFFYCNVYGIERPMKISADADNPLNITFEEVFFKTEHTSSDSFLLDVTHFNVLLFDKCIAKGFDKLKILTRSDGRVLLNDEIEDVDLMDIHVSNKITNRLKELGFDFDDIPAPSDHPIVMGANTVEIIKM